MVLVERRKRPNFEGVKTVRIELSMKRGGRGDNLIRTWCGAATQCDGIILIPPHIAVYII